MPALRARVWLVAASLAAALALETGAAGTEPTLELLDVAVQPGGSVSAQLSARGALPGGGSPELLVDGQPVPATMSTSAPAGVALVIETSSSMGGGRLASAQAAARSVIDALPPGTQVAVVAFENDPIVLAPLASDRALALAAVDSLQPGRGSALYDAVVAGTEVLRDAAGGGSLVLLTYGWESGGASVANRAAGVAAARERSTPVFVGAFGADFDAPYLRDLAAVGGGDVFTAADAMGGALAARVADSLRTGYVLEAAPGAVSAGSHELRVRWGAQLSAPRAIEVPPRAGAAAPSATAPARDGDADRSGSLDAALPWVVTAGALVAGLAAVLWSARRWRHRMSRPNAAQARPRRRPHLRVQLRRPVAPWRAVAGVARSGVRAFGWAATHVGGLGDAVANRRARKAAARAAAEARAADDRVRIEQRLHRLAAELRAELPDTQGGVAAEPVTRGEGGDIGRRSA